jgi:hypothetical protein
MTFQGRPVDHEELIRELNAAADDLTKELESLVAKRLLL